MPSRHFLLQRHLFAVLNVHTKLALMISKVKSICDKPHFKLDTVLLELQAIIVERFLHIN
jgi:hypothetical protein